jgi:hypothetical protein
LEDRFLLYAKDDDVFATYAYGAGSLLDGFHGIFDLKEMAIG